MADATFTFLLTTDNHMGFRENDHLRRKDSYMAFAEALSIARARDVDFVLLGGDLFHVNRPSPDVEHKCIKIIRQHMNAPVERGTSFKRIQGNFSHFHKLSHANFEDTNFKVPYPIMTIHGNHDDPVGSQSRSVCEKLATCGLLNYFGAIKSDEKVITIEPIVLQKGPIKIALYGLGFIPDYKLKMAFDKGEVVFQEPPDDTFNILVVHQNRIPFNKNKYIPDELFPLFFHLIVRGHEHNAQSPDRIPDSDVNGIVYQPGSTVATSISALEATPKRVGLMKVKINNPAGDRASLYKMDYELIELKACRRMLLKDISQKEISKHMKKTTNQTRVTTEEFKSYSKRYVEDCIRDLIEQDKSQRESQEKDSQLSDSQSFSLKMHRFDLPLVRIRLEYTSKNQRFDEIEIGYQFYPNHVANKDIVLYKRQKLDEKGDERSDEGDENEDEKFEFDHIDLSGKKRETIEVFIEDYFNDKPPEGRLQSLPLQQYMEAVRNSDDGNIISKVLNVKKQRVFVEYLAAIKRETPTKFHDEHIVHKWFLNAFAAQGVHEKEEEAVHDEEAVIVID